MGTRRGIFLTDNDGDIPLIWDKNEADTMGFSKMHPDEIETDVNLVHRLLTKQCPQWAGLPICRVLSSGTDNAMYRLGDKMVVRLPRIGWAVEAVEREHAWLPRLASLLPAAIPRPLFKGAPGEGYPYPWSVYEWIEGETPVAGKLADPLSLIRQLAEFITALQRVNLPGGPPAARSGPLATRREAVRAALAQLEGIIDLKPVHQAWQAALQLPDWSGPPVWLHSDLAPGNLLLVNGQLKAVIDFSGVGLGDPACDLPVAWNLLPARQRPLFRAALGVDKATWQRGRGWALAIALVQLPYYQHTNPALAASARRTIGEVLADAQQGL